MEVRDPLGDMLHSTVLSWPPIAPMSPEEVLVSPTVRYFLERQIRAVSKSMGFDVKVNVDVVYWLCKLGNYLTPLSCS